VVATRDPGKNSGRDLSESKHVSREKTLVLLLGPQKHDTKFYSVLGTRMENELVMCWGGNDELRVASGCNSGLGEKFGQGSIVCRVERL